MSDLLRALAPPNLLLPDALVANVGAAYASEGRAYHTLRHVEEVARHFDWIRREVGWKAPREVYLAVLYHDAVYVPGAADNEHASATLARHAVASWLPDDGIGVDQVTELIVATKNHGAPVLDASDDLAMFMDADMAILGASADAYDDYARGVATEYASLPKEQYRQGRERFLRAVLASESIFLSPAFRKRFETQARDNIQRELAATVRAGDALIID